MANNITAFGGWLLSKAVEIDEQYAGFAGHLHRCSDERRHVIAAYLSRDAPAQSFDTLGEVGLFLARASHHDILAGAFHDVPRGYRGALGRSGPQPYPRRHYRYLHLLLSSDRRPSMKRLVQHLPRVNPSRLRVARILPPDLRRASVVMTVKDDRTARDLAILVRLFEGVGADRAAMVRALLAVEKHADLRDWARRWAFRTRLPDHPVPSADGYTAVQSADDLKRLATRHRNCARNYLVDVLEGRSAFGIASEGSNEAVVHLVNQRGVWVLDDVFGPANSQADPALVEKATDHLARHGIGPRGQLTQQERPWAALLRIAGHLQFDDWGDD